MTTMPAGRTPHGVRGLKFGRTGLVIVGCQSHPSRGAWIEIAMDGYVLTSDLSHPSRGAWIEIIARLYEEGGDGWSHPSRGAWIEIRLAGQQKNRGIVAPLTGCVD